MTDLLEHDEVETTVTVTKRRRWDRAEQRSVLLALALFSVYLLSQRFLPRWLSGNPDLSIYVIQPLLWGGLAWFAVDSWRRLHLRPRFNRGLTIVALIGGLFHLSVTVLTGAFSGFGDSPAAGSLLNYPRNGLYFTTLLLGLETTRAYLFHVWRRRSEEAAFAAVTGLLFVAATPWARLSVWPSFQIGVENVASWLIPGLALSLLATWLVKHGGMGPSIAYLWPLAAFEWWSRVLPSHEWMMLLLIGVAVPLIAVRLIPAMYEATDTAADRPLPVYDRADRAAWVQWGYAALTVIVVASMVAGGLAGLRPAVISGISMEPELSSGDFAIIDDVAAEDLEIGDIVRVRVASAAMIHRIVDIEDGPDGLVFTTQGDNVERPDPPVAASAIDGRVVVAVPLLGLPVVWLKGAS